MTEVTVAVATYNRADLIDGLIINVLNQTYDDFDIVIVDDGSTDRTGEVLSKYADCDRIHIHTHAENKGVGAAKDKATSLATGKYIAFLDDDDRWMPSKLQKQVALFESLPEEYAVVRCEMEHIKDDEKVRVTPVTQVGDIFPEILIGNEIGFSSTLVRREYIKEVGGFDPELPRAVDWDLWIRLAKQYKFEGLNEVLVQRYIQEDSITMDSGHSLIARKMMREKYSDVFQDYPTVATQFDKHMAELQGFEALKAGERVKAFKYRWQVLQLGKPTLKNIGMLGLAVVGPRGYHLVKEILSRFRH